MPRAKTPFVRRSIKTHFFGYCGDAAFFESLGSINDSGTQFLFCSLFVTGARLGELLTLTRGQVVPDPVDKNILWIRNILVEKQHKRVRLLDGDGNPVYVQRKIRQPDTGEWIVAETDTHKLKSVSVKDYRSFPLSLKDPGVDLFKQHVEDFVHPEMKMFPISSSNAYYRIASVDAPDFYKPNGASRMNWTHFKGPWWPHRLRAERASQLIVKYNYNTLSLMQWFGWKSEEEPVLYAKLNPQHLVDLMYRGKM